MMTYQNQKNGCYQPPPGSRQDHVSPDVARLIQLEEGIRPVEKKKHGHGPHHKREHRDKDHCSVDMNGLETNVWEDRAALELRFRQTEAEGAASRSHWDWNQRENI